MTRTKPQKVQPHNSIQKIANTFIKNKNNKTFSVLINRLKPGLSSFIYKYIQDRDLINEILSQTFISIWEKIDQYKSEYSFSTWAYAIARNEALGQLRSRSRMVSHDTLVENHSKLLKDFNQSGNSNFDFNIHNEDPIQELYDASINAIYKLKEPYKTVMIEREVNRKQLQDIASDLGWNESTVKTRLRKARKDVAVNLNKSFPELIESYREKI